MLLMQHRNPEEQQGRAVRGHQLQEEQQRQQTVLMGLQPLCLRG
jgi:hypothetical protein